MCRVYNIYPYVEALDEYPVTDDIAAMEGCDALALVTAHQDFASLDLQACAARMRTAILVDGRNAFDADDARAAGFRYYAVGRGDIALAEPV